MCLILDTSADQPATSKLRALWFQSRIIQARYSPSKSDMFNVWKQAKLHNEIDIPVTITGH